MDLKAYKSSRYYVYDLEYGECDRLVAKINRTAGNNLCKLTYYCPDLQTFILEFPNKRHYNAVLKLMEGFEIALKDPQLPWGVWSVDLHLLKSKKAREISEHQEQMMSQNNPEEDLDDTDTANSESLLEKRNSEELEQDRFLDQEEDWEEAEPMKKVKQN